MPELIHKPVLLRESIEALNIRPDGVYVDGTLGRAGHSIEIAQRLTTGRLICVDRDQAAIDSAQERLAPWMDRVTLVHRNFCELGEILKEAGVSGADGMLFDLGVSSPQLDDPARGFSYMHDAPLDMRMDESQPLSAHNVVNEWDFEDLRRILYDYGEERYAPRIARAIVEAREEKTIQTTGQLVEIIKSAMPAPALREKQHPAKRSFQAIRIAVNGELDALPPMLEAATDGLNPGRKTGGDYLPVAGGSDRQKDHAGAGHRLYLSAGISGVCVRTQAEADAGDPQAHRVGRRGTEGKSPCPQRPSCVWAEKCDNF
jgi:16S rRNA (cytosine1402-N4)-methyltransferase